MRVYGELSEDKIPLFDTVDTLKICLEVINAMFPGITFNKKRMSATAGEGYSTATDIAEYLVKKGVPFREAHEITGRIVLHCINKNIGLNELDLKELKSFSQVISKDIFPCLEPAASVRGRSSYGGTSPSQVIKQIRRYKKILS